MELLMSVSGSRRSEGSYRRSGGCAQGRSPRPAREDVKFVRWPAERHLRDLCRQERIPCLLVVEGGAEPPVCSDPREDWVRTPISPSDLDARVAALRQRSHDRRTPVLDPAGTLSFRTASVVMSSTHLELMDLFVERFGQVVYRWELMAILTKRDSTSTRNALDLHIMRMRKRIAPLDLDIVTAWGRGYALEEKSPWAAVASKPSAVDHC
ncbi:winged helix-turn-helix domain-containing protein [Verrucosispora sp. WMMA2044]|uniref:helix-turn-helix domain-containing protein n=1 Tax=Verrucosispora sp. WMMA2044 TaxID=3016419 RepID=UPI00248BA67E|nr:winged helix-turn-helix domain-containing protein [Verrucosispora sp. WMMA2044]WBB50249.1 winged helix-turn-helix domain-containing protein [Verrucosispora sp. WMMA2044]